MSVIIDEEDYIAHYGILRKSGRYPWGSGKDTVTRAQTFKGMVKELRSQGLSDTVIAEGFGMTSSEFRNATSIANNAVTQAKIAQAEKLRLKGYSNGAIAREMGLKGESSVRALLTPGVKERNDILTATAQMLRDEVAEKKFIDVGKGVELHRGISAEKLKTAVTLLKNEGYRLDTIKVTQLGTGKETTVKVLSGPGMTYSEVLKNRDNIQQITMVTGDRGRKWDTIQPPISISSKRVKVRYAEEGGANADGVIYIRPGVKDTSIGTARYAQVRIAVDGTHYLKGMAMRGDPRDFPPGTDLVFNTNKSDTGNKFDAMKPMKDDPKDPFGATIDDQIYKKHADGSFIRDEHGNRVVDSVMNIVNAEGRWDEWNRTLSSQMLSKQSSVLAKKQLDLVQERKRRELDEIMRITNPTLKEHLLLKYSESADAAAVHLKAAALPRQATKVILPLASIKETEVYAPTFNDGERVVLIRFPHGGTFEIPELRVNNKNPEGKKLIGPQARDAIGIHAKVAERLSGADFDGDTVLVIPNNQSRIKNSPPLEGLDGFDPKSAYRGYDGMPEMSARTMGIEMGKVSNLITDMTIGGAPFPEIERAVKHSMVVIDARKHNLDYRRSAIENGIPALVKKYQKKNGGASTLISNSGSKATIEIPERKLRPAKDGGPIDPATGKLMYVPTGRMRAETKLRSAKDGGPIDPATGKRVYVPTGRMVPVTQKLAKLAVVDDASKYISDRTTPIEKIYADHSNALKGLANQARKETLSLKPIRRSSSAAETFAPEVKRLDAALNLALRNAPLERQAQIIGNAIYRQKLQANPDMDDAEKKKTKSKAQEEARIRIGARKDQIVISPREWEAIQAGAISPSKLKDILENTDTDKVKELAIPRETIIHDPAMRNRAVELLRGDQYTQAEVANHLGISVSTLVSMLSGA